MSENVWLVWRLQSPLQLLSAARPEMLLKLKFMKLIWVVSTSQLKSAWTHQSRKICFQSRAHQLFHQLERAYEGRLLSSGKCSIQCFFFRLCCSKSFTCFWKIVSFTLGMQKSAYRDRNRLVLGMGISAAQIHRASFHRLSYAFLFSSVFYQSRPQTQHRPGHYLSWWQGRLLDHSDAKF